MILLLWYRDGVSKKFYRAYTIAVINKKPKKNTKTELSCIIILNKQHSTTNKDVCNGNLTT